MGKSELSKYRNTPLMDITIRLGKQKIKFNLFKELRIDEDQIDDELKRQPSYYGFILLVHQKLKTEFENLKHERKRVEGRLLKKFKAELVNGRPMNDEVAKASVLCHKDYLKATADCIRIKDQCDCMYAAVKAFEQRKDLLQTICSNNRNFNK